MNGNGGAETPRAEVDTALKELLGTRNDAITLSTDQLQVNAQNLPAGGVRMPTCLAASPGQQRDD